jgi:hypothetical protein
VGKDLLELRRNGGVALSQLGHFKLALIQHQIYFSQLLPGPIQLIADVIDQGKPIIRLLLTINHHHKFYSCD